LSCGKLYLTVVNNFYVKFVLRKLLPTEYEYIIHGEYFDSRLQ
jgi:hypothetical protein